MVEQNCINRKLEGKIITDKEKNITMERQFFVLRKLKVNWTVLSLDKTKTLFFNNVWTIFTRAYLKAAKLERGLERYNK